MAVSASPKNVADRDLSLGLRLSIGLHVGLAFLILVKAFIFPGNPVTLVPTLRVDVVGLPDILKKDLKNAQLAPPVDKKKAEPKKEIPPPPKNQALSRTHPVEQAKPNEMVLHPKKLQAKNQAQKRHQEQVSEEKLKSALDRIRALEKISSELHNETAKADGGVLIKGNRISKGASLSGDARESDHASYFETIRDRLQENWEIPIWFKNQGLSAKVLIFINRDGHLRDFRFVKPSGNAQFDDAVKRTITTSDPFQPPPENLVSTVMVDGILVGFPL